MTIYKFKYQNSCRLKFKELQENKDFPSHFFGITFMLFLSETIVAL